VKVKNMQEFTCHVVQVFPLTKKELICDEQLWMSDFTHPDHYRKAHPLNKGRYIYVIASDELLIVCQGLS